ncbi:MAG: hypothetical protein ACR2NN_21050 [Bryobacteraceae bacterium]
MTIALPKCRPNAACTQVYEIFDPRVLGHLWFVAVCDGESVQMLVPTFRSERAARIFEYCYSNHPAGFLLSIDSQLELGRRIETRLAAGALSGDAALRTLCEGLAFETECGTGILAGVARTSVANLRPTQA